MLRLSIIMVGYTVELARLSGHDLRAKESFRFVAPC